MFNVKDFPTFQAAHDAMPSSGGTILVPAGTYSSTTTTAFTGLIVTKPLVLVGEAEGPGAALSILVHNMAGAQNIDAILLSVLGGCVLKNLFIQCNGIQGTGRGVRWYKAGTAGMTGLTVDNVTILGSSNFAFEFSCDGGLNNWVSKLEMIQCTAFDAASGGSLFLGGAGTNNNWFERCEFNGPGFGGFFNVTGVTISSGSPTITAPSFLNVQVGDEVNGLGINPRTTVLSVNTGSTPNTALLSAAAVTSVGPTIVSFYRLASLPANALPRGHVHLMRTSISRFHHCSFQGNGDSPAISADLPSNYLVLRDCYREKLDTPSTVHSFIINGVVNLLIDGLYHNFHGSNSMLLKTGPLGVAMGRIANAQLVCSQAPLAGTDVVELSNAADQLIVDNSMEISMSDGSIRDLVFLSTAPGTVLPTIPSAATIALPNGGDEAFLVSGSTTITTITARLPKRRATLVFTGTAQMTDGSNLRLNGNFTGSANRTITLLCDGANWVELSRSVN